MAMATSFFSPSVMFGGLIFLGLLVLAFSQFRRFPILSFGILWFFIGLAPTSNLAVPINGLIYEHWLYLPMIGIFLVLIWLGMLLGKKYNLQKILLGVLIAFLIFLSVLTINRNKDWIDPITFYNQTLKYAPTSYRVLNNLGMAYDDAGDYNRAETTYQRAIGVDASNPIAYYNLGNTYRKTGNTDGAIENFKTALSLDPEFTFSYDALVGVYMGGKEYQEALAVLQNYLNYSDSKTDTLYVMAEIAAEEKDFKAAVSYLEEALKINPHDQRVQNFIADINNATRSIK
jgi:tetratricopeptide (TPR) repeat protein